jgi:hypothetical protein
VVGQLLAAGANPYEELENGSSPLSLAVMRDYAGVVQQVLDAPVQQQCEDEFGPSAVMLMFKDKIQALRDRGTVFGPEVSKLRAVKAVLKLRKCSCCGRWLCAKKYHRCSRCKAVYYCGPEFQKKHWRNGHKEVCKAT